MGIIGWIGIIISAIKALPDLIRLFRAILELIRQLKPGVDRKALLAEFHEALDHAKKTKDTSKLDAFHAKLVGLCADGSCNTGV